MEKKWFIGSGPLGGMWKDFKIKLDSTFRTLCHYFAQIYSCSKMPS